MAELSGFWTTSGAPAGHQQVSYTQAHWSTAATILAACAGYEGVAGNYLNALLGTYISANHVHIDTGVALVDGKWYINDSVAGVTIPNAAPGTIRLDRIVLRCSWADFHVELTVLTGTAVDLPSITQTSGTTYDILLYQASVTDAGVVTLTDERTVSRVNTNGIEVGAVTLVKMAANSVDSDQYVDGSIDTIHIANDAVDDTKVGNRVPQLYRRQGGSATAWNTAGTNNYTPTTVRIQCGVSPAFAAGHVTVTFPVAFSDVPLVVACGSIALEGAIVSIDGVTATDVTLSGYDHDGIALSMTAAANWIAIGPE